MTCRSCGADSLSGFYEVKGIPAQSTVLLDTSEEATTFPTGDLRLAFCDVCGFIQNDLFDPDLIDYGLPTEESQAFSPLFVEYATDLVDRLVREHDLGGGHVLEVGSGKGEFLDLLADRGIGSGLGIDPGFLPGRGPEARPGIEFRREFYGPDHVHLTADLIVARHLLEHVPDVNDFLGLLAQSVAGTPGSGLFIEVPDTGRVLREAAFWDVYYEHCSYFTPTSMRGALESAGLKVAAIDMGFNDQYILSWSGVAQGAALPQPVAREEVGELAARVDQFAAQATTSIAHWQARIEEQKRVGNEVVVWGASSKAVGFLSSISVGDVTVVDINPHKQGKWLPGVGLEVKGPSSLSESRPGYVIVMNPIYVEEITADLHRAGLDPIIEALG